MLYVCLERIEKGRSVGRITFNHVSTALMAAFAASSEKHSKRTMLNKQKKPMKKLRVDKMCFMEHFMLGAENYRIINLSV